MSARECLKLTRAELAEIKRRDAGAALVIAFDVALQRHALTSREAWEAREVLELLAAPAHVAAGAALARYHRTRLDADGLAARAAILRPGANAGLEDWLEAPGRTLSDVLRLIDKAIEKSKPGRDA